MGWRLSPCNLANGASWVLSDVDEDGCAGQNVEYWVDDPGVEWRFWYSQFASVVCWRYLIG